MKVGCVDLYFIDQLKCANVAKLYTQANWDATEQHWKKKCQ